MFCSVDSKANKMSFPSYQTKSQPSECVPVNSGCAGISVVRVSVSSLVKSLCYMNLLSVSFFEIIVSSFYSAYSAYL